MNKEESPNYYIKFQKYCRERRGESKFLEFLENLNQLDWVEIIKDIALNKIWVKYMAQRCDCGYTVYYATFFKKLEKWPITLLKSALEDLVYRYITDYTNKEGVKILKEVLVISFLLRCGPNENLISEFLVIDENVPQDIRFLAARAIAHYNINPMPITFWTEKVNLCKFPFLTPVCIMALEKRSPPDALEIYKKIPTRPKNMKTFKPSTAQSIKNLLIYRNGGQILSNILEEIPKWAKKYIEKEILEK